MDADSLAKFDKPELIELVLKLEERIAQLEARLKIPPKTPDNSSLPPSKGQKADRPERQKKPRVMTKTCLRHAAGPASRASSAPTPIACSTSMRRPAPAAGRR